MAYKSASLDELVSSRFNETLSLKLSCQEIQEDIQHQPLANMCTPIHNTQTEKKAVLPILKHLIVFPITLNTVLPDSTTSDPHQGQR